MKTFEDELLTEKRTCPTTTIRLERSSSTERMRRCIDDDGSDAQAHHGTDDIEVARIGR